MEELGDQTSVNLAVTDSISLNFKDNFDLQLVEYDDQHQGSHRKAWTAGRILEVIKDIKKAQATMSSGQRRTAMSYYWMGKYDVITTEIEDCLIFKRLTASAPTVRILPREKYFDVLLDIHESCGHGGRDKILYDIKNRYYIPKKAVEIFLSLCPICETKRNAPRKGDKVTKQIVSCDYNLRGQVDVIDFQSCPDGDFMWLLNYQDNTTKFINLRPLKTKKAVEVALELMKIFLTFGAPYILQSDSGREFTANVIKELDAMWPECKIVHGNLSCPQTQGSNEDVGNMLRTWMNENKSTNWSKGCFFVQYLKNASLHQIIRKSPYKALFGREPKAGLDASDIPTSILSTLKTEEQLKTFTGEEPTEAMNNDYIPVVELDGSDIPTSILSTLKTEEQLKTFTGEEPTEAMNNDYIPIVELDASDVSTSTLPTIKTEEQLKTFTGGEPTEAVNSDYESKVELDVCDIPMYILPTIKTEEHLQTFTGKEPAEAMNSDYDNNSKTGMENINNLQPNICAVCSNDITGAHKCESCHSVVQAICKITMDEECYSSKVVNSMCQVEQNINVSRERAHKGVKRAAETIIDATVKKIPTFDIGTSVSVKVPKEDRGPLNMKHIHGKIVDMSNDVHKVGTKYGTIRNWFSQQQLHYSDTNYGEISESPISLKEAVASQSPFSGQGSQKCSCKPAVNQCHNNRCACFKNKVLCGYKCHRSLTCVNN